MIADFSVLESVKQRLEQEASGSAGPDLALGKPGHLAIKSGLFFFFNAPVLSPEGRETTSWIQEKKGILCLPTEDS